MVRLWSPPLSWALICWLRSSVGCGPASPWHFRLSLYSGPCIHPSGQNEDSRQVLNSISFACCRWRIDAQSRGKNIRLRQAVCTQESLFHSSPFWCSSLESWVGFSQVLAQTDTGMGGGGGGLIWRFETPCDFFHCHFSLFCTLTGVFGSWGRDCGICGGPLLPIGEKSDETNTDLKVLISCRMAKHAHLCCHLRNSAAGFLVLCAHSKHFKFMPSSAIYVFIHATSLSLHLTWAPIQFIAVICV